MHPQPEKVDSSLVAHYQENLREWRRPQKYLPPDHAARGKSNNSEKNWNQGQNCLIHRRKRLYPCHSSPHIVFKVNGEDFSSPSAETSPPAGDFGFRHCRNILYHIMTLRCKWRARGQGFQMMRPSRLRRAGRIICVRVFMPPPANRRYSRQPAPLPPPRRGHAATALGRTCPSCRFKGSSAARTCGASRRTRP